MDKKKTSILAGAGILLLAVFGYLYFGVLYKDQRNITTEKAAFSTTASVLTEEYTKDSKSADLKYLNKTIEVTGKVNEVQEAAVVLDPAVLCSFDSSVSKSTANTVTIKGRCIGFDELFGEVKLDQCTIKE